MMLADEIAKEDDGFITVQRKPKPKPIVIPKNEELPPSPDAIYHPDFAETRSPSDSLFRTNDGVLFWFSLSLLAHHAPYLAQAEDFHISPLVTCTVVHLHDIDSDVFALIAHTLLLDYQIRQRAIMLVDPKETLFPPSLALNGAHLTAVIDRAVRFAKMYGMRGFRGMLLRLMAGYAG
jgi:hypothetical protein